MNWRASTSASSDTRVESVRMYVMRPTGPSSPSSSPSYSRWASAMVRLAEKRSLRAASCCSFDVMNGGCGRLRRSLRSTCVTWAVPARSSAAISSASAWVFGSALVPSQRQMRATNGGGSAARQSQSTVQYSSGLNSPISRSRSQIIRTATDCTRPADSPRRTFFHRIGLIS